MLNTLSKIQRKHLFKLTFNETNDKLLKILSLTLACSLLYEITIFFVFKDLKNNINNVFVYVLNASILFLILIKFEDKYKDVKINLFRQILKRDLVINTIVNSQSFQELVIRSLHKKCVETKDKTFLPRVLFNILKSCDIGELFYREVKEKYPLFSDLYTMYVVLLNLNRSKTSQFKLDKLKYSLIKNKCNK